MQRIAADLRRRHLHLDCFSGIAGDMFLGAMLDLGVPEELLREQLAGLGLSGFEFVVGRRAHHGLAGCDVQVQLTSAPDHDHAHHPHRPYRAIDALLERAELPEAARRTAQQIFARLAHAEAKVHGCDVDEVEFHEVGAIDAIVDITGAALALAYLEPVSVSCRPVPLGHGFTRGSHGTMPVPAPATVELLRGLPVEDGGIAFELCTPTGAAIVAEIVEHFGELPTGPIVAVGYGAGDKSLAERPNHLRAFLVEPAERLGVPGDAGGVMVVEANIDDMLPEWCGYLMDRLFGLGARDVWYTPIVMKKGRPALKLSVLCAEADREHVIGLLLSESTTTGLRYYPVQRRMLQTRWVEVRTEHGTSRVKEGLAGETVLNASPELEDCRRLAERTGVPLKELYAEVMYAYRARSRGG